MKEPTMKEVLALVSFKRNSLDGSLVIDDVFGYVAGNVLGNVHGNVKGNVWRNVCGTVEGDIKGNVWGNVCGSVSGVVGGSVLGTINGCKWQFVETPKQRAIRLIREGKSEEALKVLEEGE